MKNKKYFALVIFSTLVLISAKPGPKVSDKNLYRFITGVMLLKNSGNLNDSVKAEYYRELVGLTGVDKNQVFRIIKTRYYENPAKWEEVYEKVLKNLKNGRKKE